MINFDGKNVLVTGGSRGIGAATVELFASLGARVAFNYNVNKKAAQNLLEKLSTYKTECFFQKCDISIYSDVELFVNATINNLGKIDILVNNAGIWEFGAIDTMTNENWHRTININLNSVFYFTKLVVAHMKKQNINGKIIHIASTAAQRGEAFHSHYATSKGGIVSFTKSLAAELGNLNITVNCVAPGWVKTDMTTESLLKEGEKVKALIPINRIPDAHEIAGPIVFLASDWATAITGEILNVNGGSVLCG